MKKFGFLILLFWTFLFFPLLIEAQENQTSEWIRARSDNGEFSVEFPAAYDFYGDNNGFLISSGSQSYLLTEMRMLNAFHEKTLLSVEAYKTNSPKAAADIFAERDDKNGKETEIKTGKLKFRQVLIERENLYAIRRFFTSENYVYVLTAASRGGATPALKRFLDSVAFKTLKSEIEPAQASGANTKIVLFSALKFSHLVVDQNPEPFNKPGKTKAPPLKPADSENTLPLSIIVKPNPSYTEAARKEGESGTIRVRLTFSENGGITKIGFLSALNGGLVRQVVFAAIRLKFLPKEKDGAPLSSVRVVDYSFSIY